MKQTQKEIIVKQLEQNGEISRNFCLKNYISRLSGIIHTLKKEGWEFETEIRPNVKPDGSMGKDFVYKVKNQTLF